MDIYNRKRRLGRWKSMDGVWFCRTKLGEIRPDSIESHISTWERKVNKSTIPRLGLHTREWEKAMAPHSSTLAWKIPWTEGPGWLQSMGLRRVGHDWLHFHFSLSCIREGNGTHSSVLAWRIPGSEEPGRLLSMGLHRVGHDWSDLAAAAPENEGFSGGSEVNNLPASAGDVGLISGLGCIPWRRK